MTLKKTLTLLRQYGRIEVEESLSRGQHIAVHRGYAVQRCYQDQPADVPYLFRPIRYFLVASDALHDQA